jgi:hypothetical protein
MMQRVWLSVAAGLVACAVVAAPADAQGGGGLYEPFPEPAPPESVRAFLLDVPGGGSRLALKLKDRELEKGVFVRGARRSPRQTVRAGPPSARAGRGVHQGVLNASAVALAGALAATVALALSHRRT